MEEEMKEQRRYIRAQIAALAVWAASILLIYFTDLLYGKEFYRAALYANAILFWLALAVWLALTVKILLAGRGTGNGLPGILRFFRNRPAAIADGILLFWLAAGIVVLLSGRGLPSEFLSFLQIAGFVFLIGIHGILNGSNYAAVYGKDEKGVQ